MNIFWTRNPTWSKFLENGKSTLGLRGKLARLCAREKRTNTKTRWPIYVQITHVHILQREACAAALRKCDSSFLESSLRYLLHNFFFLIPSTCVSFATFDSRQNKSLARPGIILIFTPYLRGFAKSLIRHLTILLLSNPTCLSAQQIYPNLKYTIRNTIFSIALSQLDVFDKFLLLACTNGFFLSFGLKVCRGLTVIVK